MNGSSLSKSYAFETICRFFHKEWASTTVSDITLTQLTGGYVNTLYIVENHKVKGSEDEPRKVLFRSYGGKAFGDDKRVLGQDIPMNTEVDESLIFYQQSRNGNGPRLYGIFSGGRLEEYIPSCTLTPKVAGTPDMITDLAKQYARFHHQNLLPFSQNRIEIMFQVKSYDKEIFKIPSVEATGIDFGAIMRFAEKREEEVKFVRKLLSTVKSKQVLLHFDCQYLNVIVREEGVSPVNGLKSVLVDYEISFYGPRLLDLGAHLYSRMIDGAGIASKVSGYPYPPEDERRLFIREYLKESKRIQPRDEEDKEEDEDLLLMESDVGSLVYPMLLFNCILPHLKSFVSEPIMFTFFEFMTKFYPERKKYVKSKYPQLFN